MRYYIHVNRWKKVLQLVSGRERIWKKFDQHQSLYSSWHISAGSREWNLIPRSKQKNNVLTFEPSYKGIFKSLKSTYGSTYCLDTSKSHKVTMKNLFLWITINTLQLRTYEMAAIAIAYSLIMLIKPGKISSVQSSQEAVFSLVSSFHSKPRTLKQITLVPITQRRKWCHPKHRKKNDGFRRVTSSYFQINNWKLA